MGFEDRSGGILVKSGKYAGKYMYASAVSGYIMGDSDVARIGCTWVSGEIMEWYQLPVDIYGGYFYSSASWFTHRNYKFTKEYVAEKEFMPGHYTVIRKAVV